MSAVMQSEGAGHRLAVLSFHKIGTPSVPDWETWFYIPRQVFLAQLQWLRSHDWTVISPLTFARGLAAPESLPTRSVLLTFDDGYQSMLTEALPCLQSLGYPSVVFVPVNYIGGTNSFDLDNEPEERICTWNELRRLEVGGMCVESHGVTHRTFSELSPDEQRHELENSKQLLEQGLHKRITAFAFPYGDGGSPQALNAMLNRAGYHAAFLYGAHDPYVPVSLSAIEPYRLDRVAMGPDTDLGVVLGDIRVGCV